MVDKRVRLDYYNDSMPISNIDPSPVPHELEEHNDFVSRYVKETATKTKGTVLIRRRRAEAAWAEAKKRSMVSIKNSGGEFLMFDRKEHQ